MEATAPEKEKLARDRGVDLTVDIGICEGTMNFKGDDITNEGEGDSMRQVMPVRRVKVTGTREVMPVRRVRT